MSIERIRISIFSGRVKVYVGRGDMVEFPMAVNSTWPTLSVDFFYDNGDEITLSGVGGVKISVRRLTDSVVVLSSTAMTLTGAGDPNNATYTWLAGFAAGNYVGEFYFNDQLLNEKLLITVRP